MNIRSKFVGYGLLSGLNHELHWKIENVAPDKHSLCTTGVLQNIIKDVLPEADLSIKLAALLCSCIISKDEGLYCILTGEHSILDPMFS